jgi:hypothetical protein
MAEEKLAQGLTGMAAKEPTNCCNGRVGKRAMEELTSEMQRSAAPSGVELLKGSAEIGMAAKEPTNCCNGRVGKRAMEELISALGSD